MRIGTLILAALLSTGLASCASVGQQHYVAPPRDLGELIYRGADKMIDNAPGLARGKPIIVAKTREIRMPKGAPAMGGHWNSV